MKPNRTRCRGVSMRLAGGIMLVVAAASIRPAWAGAPSREPDLLEADKAFAVTARVVDRKTLELRYAIADGYYMYRDRFKFSVNGQTVLLSRQAWPTGKWKQDASFGKVITYRQSLRLLLPIRPAALNGPAASSGLLTLAVSSQGCADAGICYPPLRQTLTLVSGSSAWVGPQNDVSSGFSHAGRSGSALADQLMGGK